MLPITTCRESYDMDHLYKKAFDALREIWKSMERYSSPETTHMHCTVYAWPKCQVCLECSNRGSVELDENGKVTGVIGQMYSVCAISEERNDGSSCPSFARIGGKS